MSPLGRSLLVLAALLAGAHIGRMCEFREFGKTTSKTKADITYDLPCPGGVINVLDLCNQKNLGVLEGMSVIACNLNGSFGYDPTIEQHPPGKLPNLDVECNKHVDNRNNWISAYVTMYCG